MNTRLLIEIGGTHTRCALERDRGPERVRLFTNAEHAGLEEVVSEYLDGIDGVPLHGAALAVAAPVDQQPICLTNLGWKIDPEALKTRFGWSRAIVVNDFEALACAVPVLSPDELFTVHAATAAPDGTVAVLGPGTGLGVSALVRCGNRWWPVSGEGGHVALAATDDAEWDILRRFRLEHGHVSAERILSGPGLLALYRIVADDPTAAAPDEVTTLAAGGDEAAAVALEMFFRFLGTVAGDVALTLGARGGVYLGGGILPGMTERLAASGFVRRYTDKGRFTDYLKRIPVYVMLAPAPALRGLSLHPRFRELQ